MAHIYIMESSKLGTQKMSRQEMVELNGGQYFKPSIDGSWLANERILLLNHARKKIKAKESL